ncbi:MAG: M48 family metallopeptidase [Phycisphaeraceae bacterium]|nr:MAG: M48 family metallopeptidase [Phycisphaeraceae bacterium]
MDFFEHQELARKRTGKLIVLFCLAVVGIVAALYLASTVALFFAMRSPEHRAIELWNPYALTLAFAIGAVLIGGGSAYKINELRAGGRVIAEHLGGRLLSHDTADFHGQRLLNVVEEMALASGVPVPPVYLLEDEEAINAFAAGYHPEDAVIGVTRGATTSLNREQLQGVIAHEFSHILSGDMRINLRLIGVLHGILLLGLAGMMIIRSMYFVGPGGRRSSKDQGNALAAILVLAAALAAIGYIGVFFGNWIKAAVSRQREFLADASAVQFTRNPDGIAGALRVLGGTRRKAVLQSPNAPEASHMFFGNALSGGPTSIFATHPPLPERIKRIDPSWDGTFLESTEPEPRPRHAMSQRPAAVTAFAGGQGAVVGAVTAAAALEDIGRINNEHVVRAKALIARVPASVREWARDPYSARGVILSMLLDANAETRAVQMQRVASADPVLADQLTQIAPVVRALPPELRLPVLEQALQPVAALSERQTAQFRELVDAFIRADDRVDLFEWILHRLVTRRLEVAGGNAPRPRVRYYALNQLGDECSTLLSAVARAGNENEADAREAFAAGVGRLGSVPAPYQPGEASGLRRLAQAIDTLNATSPKLKRALIEACATVVMHDRVVTPREAELYRAVAVSLGVPVPPLIAG